MASGGTKYGQGVAPRSLASCAIQLDVFAYRFYVYGVRTIRV